MVCNCVGCNILRLGVDNARLHPMERCRKCLHRHRSTCVACTGTKGEQAYSDYVAGKIGGEFK